MRGMQAHRDGVTCVQENFGAVMRAWRTGNQSRGRSMAPGRSRSTHVHMTTRNEGQGTVREDDGGAALGVRAQPQHELA